MVFSNSHVFSSAQMNPSYLERHFGVGVDEKLGQRVVVRPVAVGYGEVERSFAVGILSIQIDACVHQ